MSNLENKISREKYDDLLEKYSNKLLKDCSEL